MKTKKPDPGGIRGPHNISPGGLEEFKDKDLGIIIKHKGRDKCIGNGYAENPVCYLIAKDFGHSKY
jgi:hypothetical protein